MRGLTRFVAAFDPHGDQCHRPTLKALYRFCDDFKPHIRIAGGDIWDFRRWRTKASKTEKLDLVKPDFDAGMDFIDRFRPHHILLGNHDERAWRVAEDEHHADRELAQALIAGAEKWAKNNGCRLHRYHKRRVLSVGPLNVLHGFYAGATAGKQHAAVYGPVLFGHIHTDEHTVVPSHPRRRESWSAPGLCERDMDYNAGTPGTLRYSNGWLYGVFSGKSFHVDTARVEDGSAIVTSGFRMIRC